MKRRLPALLLAALLALSVSSGATLGAPKAAIFATAEEREAYDLWSDEKMLTARTRAEAALRADPGSIIGHYVLGSVLRDAEGALGRAMSHLREADRLFEARIGVRDADEEASRIHNELLIGLEYTAGLMEQYEVQLEFIAAHDALYEPSLLGQRAWPLMKLRRFDEARAAAQRAIDSGRPFQKNLGLNALCAIEAEAHAREAAYVHCLDALDHAKKRVAEATARGAKVIPHLAVHGHNAALAALSVLRHDEAERLALEGTARLESSASNPWRLLVDLYLTEGRAGDAVAAIRQMQRWYARQPPASRDQKDAETAAETALLLLAAGESEAGLRFISRALARPDRQGISSGHPEQALGGHALIRRALLRLDAEQERERASARGSIPRGVGLLSALGARARSLPDVERVVNVLSDEARLDATLRVYLDGGLEDVPTWLLGDLVPVLGPGVVSVALEKARGAEARSALAPYFDAIDAEVALALRDPTRARSLAEGALSALPRAEALLRARVAAVGGEAARQAGDTAAAAFHFQRAIELDPGTIRRLGLAIPAVVLRSADGPAAERAAEVLARSPRLFNAEGGFEVRIEPGTTAERSLRACLFASLGTSLGCGEITEGLSEPPSDAGARLAEEFHSKVFALHLPITDTDLRSLDGATVITRDAGRERLRGILDGNPEDQPVEGSD